MTMQNVLIVFGVLAVAILLIFLGFCWGVSSNDERKKEKEHPAERRPTLRIGPADLNGSAHMYTQGVIINATTKDMLILYPADVFEIVEVREYTRSEGGNK